MAQLPEEKQERSRAVDDSQFLQIHDEWRELCNSRSTTEIIRFWKTHCSILSAKGSWFLKFCIKINDVESLSSLLVHQRSLSSIDATFGHGIHSDYTPILYAARFSTFKLIQLLVSKGADVSLSANANILEYVFENSVIEDADIVQCIQYLVGLGCNVATNTIWCLSYYNAHRRFDRVHLAAFLKENGADLIHVTTAIKYGHLRLAKWLIQNKCKIYDTYLTDVKSQEGIHLLIEHGVRNIDHNDTVYGTALYYHSERGNVEAVTALLQHNADKSIRCTKEKLTALQIATKNKHDPIIALLSDIKIDTQGLRITNHLRSSLDVDFSKIPIHPMSLKDDIIAEENTADEVNATAVLIENKIESLQRKLAKEHRKILALRKEQNQRSDKIEGWKTSLCHWNEFVSKWKEWDIPCFVQWLKRISPWKEGSFERYFKSDQDAVDQIEAAILADPLTFGGTTKGLMVMDEVEDEDMKDGLNEDGNVRGKKKKGVTFGKQLKAIDRYTLFKIGIQETADCNAIAQEIQKLIRHNAEDKETDDGGSPQAEDMLCVICWDRPKTHTLGCGHRFCEKDIKRVQGKSNRCPICKQKISIVIKLY